MPVPPSWLKHLRARPLPPMSQLDLELDDDLVGHLDAITRDPRPSPRKARDLIEHFRKPINAPSPIPDAARPALQTYPNLVFETALLVACIYAPAEPVPAPTGLRSWSYGADRRVLPLYFVPRAAYAVGYYLKECFDLSPENMAAWSLKNHRRRIIEALARLPSGVAPVVAQAYTTYLEARTCRRISRS